MISIDFRRMPRFVDLGFSSAMVVIKSLRYRRWLLGRFKPGRLVGLRLGERLVNLVGLRIGERLRVLLELR